MCDNLVENSNCSGFNNNQITDRPTSYITDQCDKLTQLTALSESMKRVEQKKFNLKRDLKYVETKLDDLEQYGCSNCIIFHGSSIEQNENYKTFCEKVTEKLNNSLKLTEKVTINDINIAHNLPSAGNKRNSSTEITQERTILQLLLNLYTGLCKIMFFFSQRNH